MGLLREMARGYEERAREHARIAEGTDLLVQPYQAQVHATLAQAYATLALMADQRAHDGA